MTGEYWLYDSTTDKMVLPGDLGLSTEAYEEAISHSLTVRMPNGYGGRIEINGERRVYAVDTGADPASAI
jgi:hypothetical protein